MLTEPSSFVTGDQVGESSAYVIATTVRKRTKQGHARLEKHERPEPAVSYLKVLTMTLLRQIEELESSTDGSAQEGLDLKAQVQKFEAELIRSALITTGGRQRRAARLLKMKVTTLNTKIRRYQITLEGEPNQNQHLPCDPHGS